MFTGIVSEVGSIKNVNPINGGSELFISCSFAADTHIDESISVNGVCLTVTEQNKDTFKVQCVAETLRKTSLGELKAGDEVNLERSLTLASGIEGHIVQGHVDTTGTIAGITENGNDRLIEIHFDKENDKYIVGRGSICVDGISLTVAREKSGSFTVAIIPYTWDFTNLRNKKVGDKVNLEFDLFGKYIVRYLEKMMPDQNQKRP
jgi:riboflavin synthase